MITFFADDYAFTQMHSFAVYSKTILRFLCIRSKWWTRVNCVAYVESKIMNVRGLIPWSSWTTIRCWTWVANISRRSTELHRILDYKHFYYYYYMKIAFSIRPHSFIDNWALLRVFHYGLNTIQIMFLCTWDSWIPKSCYRGE